MAGNLMYGFLFIALFALLLSLGTLILWTIHELPEIIRDWLEWRKWRKMHTHIFFT